jgi:hypothetical protein
MNHSMASADGNTHLKIAALAFVGAIAVVVVGFNARVDIPEVGTAHARSNILVVKAGQPTHFSTRTGIEIR